MALPACDNMPANRHYAPPDSWEQHRNEIERLYVHENRTLKVVMEIMAREHGHCATKKMYKTRLAKWKLDCKYNRNRYMKVISQKWRERAALGKGSVFTVRGKVVPGAEINRYLKRRSRYAGGQASDLKSTPTTNTPSTPSSSGEWTPSPSPGAQSATTTPTVSVEVLSSHADSMDLVATLDSDSFELPRTICLIQIPELLFRQIHRYINGCFDSGVWLPTGPETIASTRPTATLPNIGDTQCNPSTFFECCVSASRLLMQHKYDTAGRQLSTACAMVKPIFLAEDPRALQVFLNVLLLFKQQGFKDVADQLRRYIGAIAQYSTPEGTRSTTSTPLKQICGSLAETVADIQMSPTGQNSTHIRTQDDSDTDVLVAAWRCIVDSYQQQLGQVHGAVIGCELELLGRQTEARSADLQGAETNLRKMLHSCENLTELD
ncbi:hypothetical protein LTS15_010030 [Exophiala xenobiotica]|nr:hypothetical protein LTS15_010030 [Exophiala xenobiotica]